MKRVVEIARVETALKAIAGQTILTLVADGLEEPLVIDMHADGTLGYSPAHRARFSAYLDAMLEGGGAMIVRQFTPLEQPSKTGRRRPIKRVFGLAFDKGSWRGLSSEDIRIASTKDPQTGAAIPAEEAVIYCDFPPTEPQAD